MSHRLLHFGAFLVCLSLICVALYMQHILDMEPCPLCIFQRMAIIAIGTVSLLALIHNPQFLWKKIYGMGTLLISLVGLGLSGRHVWIQNLPEDKVPSCGPGLNFMMETMPLQGVIEKVLQGSGECHEINWIFLGLTIPGWTFVLFSIFLVFGFYQIFSRQHLRNP